MYLGELSSNFIYRFNTIIWKKKIELNFNNFDLLTDFNETYQI